MLGLAHPKRALRAVMLEAAELEGYTHNGFDILRACDRGKMRGWARE